MTASGIHLVIDGKFNLSLNSLLWKQISNGNNIEKTQMANNIEKTQIYYLQIRVKFIRNY